MAELRIVEYHNELLGDAKHRAAWLSACPAPSSQLSQLRERYRLDEVIAPAAARGEFAQLMALTEWVHTRFRHGWHHPDPPITAQRVLEAAAEGYDCNCAYFAITLAECCQALGFVTRAVSICKDHTDWKAPGEGNTGHSVVEVWSHQFHKWVLLDADANVHYLAPLLTAEGGRTRLLPLSVLEIHQAWVGRRWAEVEQRLCGPTPFRMTDTTPGAKSMPEGGVLDALVRMGENWDPVTEIGIFNHHRIGDYYHYLNYSCGPLTLSWVDRFSPPRLVEHGAPVTAQSDKRVMISEAMELDWPVDQVQISLRLDDTTWDAQADASRVVVHVSLRHSMPNLAALLIKVGPNEPFTPFQPTTVDEATGEKVLAWVLRPGKNQVMAKGINSFGREGHVSRVLLRYFPTARERL
jgi:hypothetical protein